MTPWDGRPVDEILDEGARGLEYFEHYVPILERVRGGANWNVLDLCAWYDQQRGMNLGVLSADATALTQAIASAWNEVEVHRHSIGELDASWSGQAARAAVADMQSDLDAGVWRVELSDQLAQTMHAAVVSLDAAIRDKAAAIGRFDPSTPGRSDQALVDGKTLDSIKKIDQLAGLTPGRPETSLYGRSLIDAVAQVLPRVIAPAPAAESVPSLLPLTPESNSLERDLLYAQVVCEEWLRDTFVPIVSAACEHLVDICQATDSAVRDYLSVLAAVAESVDSGSLPAVDGGGAPTAAESPQSAAVPTTSTLPSPSSPQSQAQSLQSSSPPSSGVVPIERGGTSSSGAPIEMEPRADVPRTVDPLAYQPVQPEKDLLPALEKMFGAVPTPSEFVDAIERSGHELTDRMKSVLDDAIGQLGAACPDDPAPPGSDAPANPAESGPLAPDGPAGSSAPDQPKPELPTAPHLQIGENPDGGSAERGHLEASLDGHSARIALAQNGTVALELGTPDGNSRCFELRPGPFGLPVLVETDGQAPVTLAPQDPAQPGAPTQPEAPAQPDAPTQPEPATQPEPPVMPLDLAETPRDRGETEQATEPADQTPQPIVQAPEPVEQAPEPEVAVSPQLPESKTGARLVEAGPL